MIKITAALALGIFLVTPTLASESVGELRGKAKVVDGQSIRFGEIEVWLKGIAAPSYSQYYKQPGGRESMLHLKEWAEEGYVHCRLDGTIFKNKLVGTCYYGRVDLGYKQVDAGLARDCPKFSEGKYKDVEELARIGGRDLSSKYQLPDYCNPVR